MCNKTGLGNPVRWDLESSSGRSQNAFPGADPSSCHSTETYVDFFRMQKFFRDPRHAAKDGACFRRKNAPGVRQKAGLNITQFTVLAKKRIATEGTENTVRGEMSRKALAAGSSFLK